ncbi:hypothetical protein DPEC_G00015340 [Dallia pectoralis]|uniref:Uncharacterized protein n=1 Tax=Dallia pectoralis TaxID=75939 RepID=A0ACC2HNF0_DALPE|nr:hypothetical protein DPEC_G00015340 [Dallia pectoralis]
MKSCILLLLLLVSQIKRQVGQHITTVNGQICVVMGTRNHIYHDFLLIIDTFIQKSQPKTSPPPVSSTIRPFTSSSTSETPGLVVSNEPGDRPRYSTHLSSWRWTCLLVSGLCISLLCVILISIMAVVIHRRIRAKIQCTPQVENGVVYTTVDFRSNGNATTELYANLPTGYSSSHTGRGHDPDTHREHAGMVVYSTLAGNPR